MVDEFFVKVGAGEDSIFGMFVAAVVLVRNSTGEGSTRSVRRVYLELLWRG